MKISFPAQPVPDLYEVVGNVPLHEALDPVSSLMLVVQRRSDPGALVPSIRTIAGETIPSVTLAAAYLPARRATRIDPVSALRCE